MFLSYFIVIYKFKTFYLFQYFDRVGWNNVGKIGCLW